MVKHIVLTTLTTLVRALSVLGLVVVTMGALVELAGKSVSDLCLAWRRSYVELGRANHRVLPIPSASSPLRSVVVDRVQAWLDSADGAQRHHRYWASLGSFGSRSEGGRERGWFVPGDRWPCPGERAAWGSGPSPAGDD